MEPREAAWAALHTPTTEPAVLAQIAAAYPEFAEAIAAHPNVYPELRAWALAQLPAKPNPWQTLRANHSNELLISAAGLAAAFLMFIVGIWWTANMDNFDWFSGMFGGATPVFDPVNQEWFTRHTGRSNFELILIVLTFVGPFVGMNMGAALNGTRTVVNVVLGAGLAALFGTSNWSWYFWRDVIQGDYDVWHILAQLLFMLAVGSVVLAWVLAAERDFRALIPLGAWGLMFVIAGSAAGDSRGVYLNSDWDWLDDLLLLGLAAATLVIGLRLPRREAPKPVTLGAWPPA